MANKKKFKKGDLITDRHGSFGIVIQPHPEHVNNIHLTTMYKVVWMPEGYVRNPFGVDIELVASGNENKKI